MRFYWCVCYILLTVSTAVAQISNPSASGSCGSLHMALLIDESGSIQGSEVTALQNGLLNFSAGKLI